MNLLGRRACTLHTAFVSKQFGFSTRSSRTSASLLQPRASNQTSVRRNLASYAGGSPYRRFNAHQSFYSTTRGKIVIFTATSAEEVPMTKRRRFMAITPEGEKALSAAAYDETMQRFGRSILPPSDPNSRYVQRVMSRLINIIDLPDIQWEVHVVQHEIANAFVLPGGKVFVFTGILPIAQNEDGLATVLAHETAHQVARHVGEKVSRGQLVELALLAVSIMYDSTGLTRDLGRFLLNQPFSRKLETEADHIGLMLMSQACYNPNEAPRLWERMDQAEKVGIPEFLSTHPSPKHRQARLQSWMPEVI